MKKLHTKNGSSGSSGANVSHCRKTERGDPLRFFDIHSVAKHQKNAGGTRKKVSKKNAEKKCLSVPKKIERVDSLVWYGMSRGKTGKTILVQFARPNGAI